MLEKKKFKKSDFLINYIQGYKVIVLEANALYYLVYFLSSQNFIWHSKNYIESYYELAKF